MWIFIFSEKKMKNWFSVGEINLLKLIDSIEMHPYRLYLNKLHKHTNTHTPWALFFINLCKFHFGGTSIMDIIQRAEQKIFHKENNKRWMDEYLKLHKCNKQHVHCSLFIIQLSQRERENECVCHVCIL